MNDPILKEFTVDVPYWKPHVTPLDVAEATDEQVEAMKVTPSNRGVSEYVRVLALDVKTLKERTPLFNGIMYSRGGLSRAETELSAVAASVVNRCIYCTAVHASRYNELTKTEDVIANVFESGENANIPARESAIVKMSTKLSQCPSEATKEDMELLIDAGLDMAEILDAIMASALFGWANRLMHTLGEPHAKES